MTKLDDALAGVSSLGFDTVAIIYFAVDTVMAKRAAALRAYYNLRTPDALQLAAALEAGCQAFLTNYIPLKRVTELRVLILDELLF